MCKLISMIWAVHLRENIFGLFTVQEASIKMNERNIVAWHGFCPYVYVSLCFESVHLCLSVWVDLVYVRENETQDKSHLAEVC